MEYQEQRTFIITYNYPIRYRGSYLVKGVDGIDASNKCRKFLEDKWGYCDNQMSVVMEVYDNNLIVLG